MKQNLRRAAVYGVAGLATAAIGVATANGLAESSVDNAAPAPAPAPAPVAPKPVEALPKALAAPVQPAAPAHHVKPAAAHKAAVPAALSKPRVKKVRQATPQKRYVVQAAAKAPAATPLKVAFAPSTPALDNAVKAVDNARQAVKDAGKALHDAKKRLVQSEKDLEKLRDSMKPTSGKKPCHDDPSSHLIKKTGFPGDLAKRLAALQTEGKHVKKTTHTSGTTVTKTASSSGNGASSWSSATSTNGTASADAW